MNGVWLEKTDATCYQSDMVQSVERPPYVNAPIEEAIVEFRFARSDWNPTIPGLLLGNPTISTRYRGKPRTQKIFQIQVQPSAEPVDHKPNIAVEDGVGRIQLVDEAGRNFLSLGPGVLSVHTLRPYDSWAHFRPKIEEALTAYAAVAGSTDVVRIGVRYINKIVLPLVEDALAKYFESRPMVAKGFPDKMVGFLSRAEYIYPDSAKLLVTHASIESASEHVAYLLDLDVFSVPPSPLPIPDVMPVVDALHDREGQAFEATITDEARRIFNGE